MRRMPGKWQALLICAAIAAATYVAFEQVRHHEFICVDDDVYITGNRRVQEGITADSIVWAFTQAQADWPVWHPVTWLSHMLDCEFFGTNPYWHHLNNLLLHIVNSLLLFLIFKAMTGAIWPSAFTAFLFALHPMHVESVAWVSERKDVLSTLFALLTVLAYLRYVKKPGVVGYLPVFLLFGLGLMAKPMLVTLPFVLLLLDYWPLGRMKRKNKRARSLIIEKTPLLVLASLSSVVTFILQQKANVPAERLALDGRISNAVLSYIGYIVKLVYPHDMATPYPRSFGEVSFWLLLIFGLLLVSVSIIVIRAARKHPYMATGWFWYLGTLVPVIGLVQIGAHNMADRYTYVPSIGIFVLAAWGVRELAGKWRHRRITLSLAAMSVLTLLAIGARRQVAYWRNSYTLLEHTLAVTENNYVAENSYGALLCKDGRIEDGIAHLRKSVEIEPEHASALYNLGFALARAGEYPESVLYLRRALTLEPDDPHVMITLASVLMIGNDTTHDEIEESLSLAMRACEITKYQNPDMVRVLQAARRAAKGD